MGEAKRRKALDPNYGKNIVEEISLGDIASYFATEGSRIYPQDLISSYIDHLKVFGQKPSNNPLDYSETTNPDCYKIFRMFMTNICNKYVFRRAIVRAQDCHHDLYSDNFNMVIIYLWMALGFASHQLSSQSNENP